MAKGRDKMGFVFFISWVESDTEMWALTSCFILEGGWRGGDTFCINNLLLAHAYLSQSSLTLAAVTWLCRGACNIFPTICSHIMERVPKLFLLFWFHVELDWVKGEKHLIIRSRLSLS